MSVPSKDVYRGKGGRRRLWRIPLYLLAALLLLAIVLFYACQKYIVYGANGLRVVFPFMEETPVDTETGAPEQVDAELVYDEPNYDSLLSNAGKDLQTLRGQYLTADRITPDAIKSAATQIQAAGGNTLVLQMKAPGGTLSWKSSVAEAAAYGVNGTAELADALNAVKEQNVHLVAVVSCCVDSLMAERYGAVALKGGDGTAYTDGSGGWVDPYNEFVRTYLSSLCRELAEMGFDEIALSYLQTPFTDQEFAYSAELSSTPSRTDTVMNLAKHLSSAVRASGARVSVVCSADSILQSKTAQSGQDPALLAKLFDRLCVFASADNLETLRTAIAADERFDADTRFVPFQSQAGESGSWVKTA